MKTLESTYDVSQKSQFQNLVLKFTSQISSKELILLTGPLGIGKSEWVRCSLKALGYDQSIPSPSFTIHQVYQFKDYHVDHVDLYRIQKEEELESIDFFDLFLREQGLIFIEWADRLSSHLLPQDWNRTYLNWEWSQSKRLLHISKEAHLK